VGYRSNQRTGLLHLSFSLYLLIISIDILCVCCNILMNSSILYALNMDMDINRNWKRSKKKWKNTSKSAINLKQRKLRLRFKCKS
jgi:hypothetical protein